MESDQFAKHMENLKKPEPSVMPPQELKLTILNASHSATLGIWVIVVPALFLFFVTLKYYFNLDTNLLTTIEEFITRVDRNPGTWFLQPVLLLGLPLASIVINILAITHISWHRSTKVLTFAVKLRWVNLLILLISTLIVTIFTLYLIMENY